MSKLNVGSGPNYLDGWVNLDACDLFKRDYAVNLPDDKLAVLFGKDYADEIFMSDVMEHSHLYTWTEKELLGVLTDLGFRVRTTKWKADWEMVVSATKPG